MLEGLEEKMGYKFANKKLLKQALTHSSCDIHEKGKPFNNERLEFLGDAVLKLIVAEYLFKTFENYDEGILSKMIANLVSGNTLTEEAEKISISPYLFLGKGEEINGGRTRPKILEGAMEAIIGAIYLDSSLDEARAFVVKMLNNRVQNLLDAPMADAKTELQEFVQKDNMGSIKYKLIEQIGPAHDPSFKIELSISDVPYSIGKGKSKRQAEQEAAKIALEKLK